MASQPKKTGNNGRFKPGNPGKPKGATHHLTRTVKDTVLSVFNELQSDPKHSLLAFAKKHPRDFYNISAKLIPNEISGHLSASVHLSDEPITFS